MKKLILIMVSLALLCSCSKTPPEEINSENSSLSKSENSSQSEYKNTDDDNYEVLGEIEGYAIYRIKYTDGIRTERVYNELDGSVGLEEIHDTKFCIVDSNGNVLIDHFFDYCELFSPLNRYSHPEYYTLSGSTDGDCYKYIFKDGKFEKYIFEPAGENGTELFGYKLTQYYWYGNYEYYGINDSNGNVIFEPIYSKIEMPFKDRFIIGEGGPGMFSSEGEGRYLIADEKGNIYAMYSSITYEVFDDGSYIGVASVAGGDSVKCYDENGDILPSGDWFIDKDGNRISLCFDKVPKNIKSPDDIITATDENGNTVEFSARDYLCYE